MMLKRNLIRGYRPRIENFKGSYINHIPEIRSITLDENTKGLLLASDGLWDELSNADTMEVLATHSNNTDKLLKTMMDKALEVASKKSGITLAQMKKIEVGRRRSIHDDITMLYVDLKNYVNKATN